MKTTEDIELTTAGKLLDELKGFEKKYWHYNVVAWVDDDEVVGCYASIFGEYHISSWQTPQDLRDIAEERRKRKREARHETIALVIITIAVFGWLVYNIYTLFAGIGGPTWEKILWIVVCCIVLFVNGATLYHNKE